MCSAASGVFMGRPAFRPLLFVFLGAVTQAPEPQCVPSWVDFPLLPH